MSATSIRVLKPTNSTVVIVKKTESNPLQYDLFSADPKEEWMRGYEEATHRFDGPFYADEVRAIFPDCPASSKWHGNVYNRMIKKGLRQLPDSRRASKVKDRNGAKIYAYTWEKEKTV